MSSFAEFSLSPEPDSTHSPMLQPTFLLAAAPAGGLERPRD
jgi:hypothetical protein